MPLCRRGASESVFCSITIPQGLTLELATLGDLKLVEKPSPVTVGPHDFVNIKVSHVMITWQSSDGHMISQASIKVSSTENGIIFGNIGK